VAASVAKNCGVTADRKSQIVALSAPPIVLAGALWMIRTKYAAVTRYPPSTEVAVPEMTHFR
jgi:hypothetical protein